MTLQESIRKYALQNALQYNGTANSGSVLGKILAENVDLRKEVPRVKKEIDDIIKEVNKLGTEKIRTEIENKYPELLEKKDTKQELKFPDLPDDVAKNVISVFPPEPSKYPHIGHFKAAYINYWYAEKYGGKFVLRFEDNNPDLAKQEYVDVMLDAIKWLGLKPHSIDYVSNYMDEFYRVTEKLINSGDFYVCTCSAEKTSELRFDGLSCEHRDQPSRKNKELWLKMSEGAFKKGEVSVRIKIDMAHQNTTMRDPAVMRVATENHFRVGTKYNVWPLYDYATALTDKFENITFRARSKEFELRAELQDYIRKICNVKIPYVEEFARMNLEGVESSGRKIREMVQKGEMSGWDDPRLTTIAALDKRGFVADAIREFLISTGLSKTEATISWDVLNSINRKYIDKISNRYFFVKDPVEITIEGLPTDKKVAEADLHPDDKEKGKRKIPVGKKFYIERADFEKLKGKEVRLLHLANVNLEKKSIYTGNEISDMPKIHWVSEDNVPVKLVMNDASEHNGLAEPDFKHAKKGDHVQFERFGFVHVVTNKPLLAYYTHK